MQLEELKIQSQKKLEQEREEKKENQDFIEKKEDKRKKAWLDYLQDNPATI